MEFVFVCVASRYPSLTSKIASQTQVCHDVGKHDKSRNRVPFMIILREIFSITPWQYRPVTNFTLWQHMCRILQSVQKCNKKPNCLFMILLATIDHLPCLVNILFSNFLTLFFVEFLNVSAIPKRFWTCASFWTSVNMCGIYIYIFKSSILLKYVSKWLTHDIDMLKA